MSHGDSDFEDIDLGRIEPLELPQVSVAASAFWQGLGQLRDAHQDARRYQVYMEVTLGVVLVLIFLTVFGVVAVKQGVGGGLSVSAIAGLFKYLEQNHREKQAKAEKLVLRILPSVHAADLAEKVMDDGKRDEILRKLIEGLKRGDR